MKTSIFDSSGKKVKEIELPKFFSMPVREDIISKVIEGKKRKQPYAPSAMAGMQYSASGKIVHRRHVWRSGYGRGQSRIPRKITARSGSQFNWIGAEISSTRGGRRAHPPKVQSMIKYGKTNKKELKLALESALSATADKKEVMKKYGNLDEKEIKEIPVIIDEKFLSLKTKNFLDGIKKILGEKVFNLATRKKSVRKGRGKRRGRKYKKNAGALIVTGKKENIKTNAFETKNSENLGVSDLASGGPGRLVIYTEKSIKDLGERLK